MNERGFVTATVRLYLPQRAKTHGVGLTSWRKIEFVHDLGFSMALRV